MCEEAKWIKADVDHRRREVSAWTKAKNFVSRVAFLFSIPDVADFFGASYRPTQSFLVIQRPWSRVKPNRSDESDSFTAVVRTDGGGQ